MTGAGGRRSSSGPLLSLRAAVLLLVAFGAGCLAGLLTWLQYRSVPGGLLAGGAAFGVSLKLLHELVE